MQTRNLMALAIVAALALAATRTALAADGPLEDPPPMPAANFSSHDSAVFSASASTAGTADAGHEVSAVHTPLKNCNALNPCAEPPPSLEHLASPAGSR